MTPQRLDNGHAPSGGPRPGARRLTAYSLTYCPKPEALYGSTLLFKTLRVGFPTAEVHVVDNGSHPEAAAEIRRQAEDAGCHFRRLTTFATHHGFVSSLIFDPDAEGTVILLDPDLCFWADCEHWRFDKLLAGRYIPPFRNDVCGTIDLPRLHTSFWWIEDVVRLRERILREYQKSFIGCMEPFLPYTFRQGDWWFKFDTGANLFATIRDDVYCFEEKELDCFDHLMMGTHLDVVWPWMDEEGRAGALTLHNWAKHDYVQMKGLWKIQDIFFQQHPPPAVLVPVPPGPAVGWPPAACQPAGTA